MRIVKSERALFIFVTFLVGILIASSFGVLLNLSGSQHTQSPANSKGNAGVSGNVPSFSPSSSTTFPVIFTESGLSSGTLWWVSFDGTTLTSTSDAITFNVPDGTYNYVVDSSAPSGTEYTVTPSSGTITVSGFSYTQYIYYTVEYYLTVSANPSGSATVIPSSGWYFPGSTEYLSAYSTTGYALSYWSGSGSGSYTGTSTSPSITMNGPITETAYMYQPTYSVTFSESGLPSGTLWWVNLGGTNLSSSSSSITFYEPDGTYNYNVMDTTSNGVSYQTTGSGTVLVDGYSDTQYVYYTVEYYLNVQSSPSNAGTVSPASGWYLAGETVYLSATPNSGYAFSSWAGSGSGSYTGTSSLPSVTLDGPITETAYFYKPLYSVTFQESGLPAGTSWWVNLNGNNLSSTSSQITFSEVDGTYNFAVMVLSNPWVEYQTTSTGSVTVSGYSVTQYVLYTSEYYLNMSVSPSNAGTVLPSSGWHYSGNTELLSATPNSGYAFSSWSGNGNGSYTGTNSLPSVTMNGPINETAYFYLPNYQVSFTESGLPSGTLWWVNLGGTNISSTSPTITFTEHDGTYNYQIGQETPSGAEYDPGYNSGTVIVYGSSTTQDVYYSVQYYLNISCSPSIAGSLSPTSGWYYSGDVIYLTEYPNTGYAFSSWEGNGSGSYTGTETAPTITMDGPINDTAIFKAVYQVNFVESGLSQGTEWSVAFHGISKSSYGNTITFEAENGNYTYSTSNITGYNVSANIGTVHVFNSQVTNTIKYKAIEYLVEFRETGLLPGTTWSVNLSNGTVLSSADPTISFRETDGTYLYSISSELDYISGFQPGSFTIYGSNVTINTSFTPYPILKIRSAPSNSDITINGIEETPSNGFFNGSFSPGFYYINASMSGYSTYSDLLYLSAGKVYTLNISLSQLPSYGYLQGSVYPGFSTIIADSNVVPVENGHFNSSLEPGTYFVSFTADGYMSVIKEVNITAGKATSLNVSLDRITSTAVLFGYITPNNSSLVLNGFVAYVNSTGFYYIDLPVGNYRVSVFSEGYFPVSKSVDLNSIQEMNFTLTKEPKATSTGSNKNTDVEGYNVSLSNLKNGNGYISVDYNSNSNGTIIVSVPFKYLTGVTIDEVLNSSVYINGVSYSNYTITISSNYSVILKVYGLSKGDPTLFWKYQPTAALPPGNNNSSGMGDYIAYASIGVVATISLLSAILLRRRKM